MGLFASCVRCFRWSTPRSLCTCKQETVWKPVSGWRSWARSRAATRGAWTSSIHPITPEEPGSAAKTRVPMHQAANPALRECFLHSIIMRARNISSETFHHLAALLGGTRVSNHSKRIIKFLTCLKTPSVVKLTKQVAVESESWVMKAVRLGWEFCKDKNINCLKGKSSASYFSCSG